MKTNKQGVIQKQLDFGAMSGIELFQFLQEAYHTLPQGFTLEGMGFVFDFYYNEVVREKKAEIKQLKKENIELKDRAGKAEKRLEANKKIELELREELNNYHRYYGKEYVSSFDVLNKLYKGVKNKEYLDALSVLNPKSKLGINTKAIEHWLSVFEDLKIIKRIEKGRYIALRNFKEANNILFNFIDKV